jgi:hypothetical protein
MAEDNLTATIKETVEGWRWQINGDVPWEFKTGPQRYYNPSGNTMTKRGAIKEAKRMLKRIRRARASEPEVLNG